MSGIFRFHKQNGGALDGALDDWRAAEKRPETLSGPARERILEAAGRGETRRVRFELPSPLFLPARRFALAAVLPLLVLSLAVGYFLLPAGSGSDETVPQLLASRQGDEVVFVIANGDRPHRVLKAADPRGLDADQALVLDPPVRSDDPHLQDGVVSGLPLARFHEVIDIPLAGDEAGGVLDMSLGPRRRLHDVAAE